MSPGYYYRNRYKLRLNEMLVCKMPRCAKPRYVAGAYLREFLKISIRIRIEKEADPGKNRRGGIHFETKAYFIAASA
jgi:hypothetical protein